MNEVQECPVCLSDELLISDNQETIICSECGVVKKDGIFLDKRKLELEEAV
ncbi:nonsense-mediated mRNA decay protein NMD3 family protein [Aliivibrio fischeri]|uniref:nonsense-mediated mRNA decay protein NMD3 family protein n=1 Tax=Aliivibrio fischeri TaxID=668 RepID=UPI0012D95FAB|nr:nonsense-mediated mRNA decay protein NMD3 family protein [Aliivibrio fischeri]MUK63733.1 nonsense-mediated mRNA decay protein NMD3 family protein [Aliivibrio fischeri]MUK71251.1 nonsense-mediated mRNA decay protein NMD3 family protein [Aliivibrio fischeri]MUK74471.1 nonsense-mediated mRNA decay protein NMD3 family protein [Aliivibrio fischeri]MUK78460.1 nonsense-mediated mRNA decay protein NMD3 family protein [Aliivibrio fischeri]MUL22971.1 nonsense-mediated mRNA decay protein NMD3 family p